MLTVVEGVVVEGDHRGRALGFPTANIVPEAALAGADEGIYGGYTIRADGSRHVAAISIGRRPQYYGDDGPLIVEAYLLDFDGDLYGELITVEVHDKVRGQLTFSSEPELVAQIGVDVADVRAWSENAADLLD